MRGNYNLKSLNVAVSLRVAAQGGSGNVLAEIGQQFDMLVKALGEKFAALNQHEVYSAHIHILVFWLPLNPYIQSSI